MIDGTSVTAKDVANFERDDLLAIEAGLVDMEAGRYRLFEQIDAEFRKKHNIPGALPQTDGEH